MAENTSPPFYSRESSYGNTGENLLSKRIILCVKISSLVVFVLLYNAYLIWATYYSFSTGSQSWCEDIRLVIVITLFVYSLIALSQLSRLYYMSALSGLPTFIVNRFKTLKYVKYSASALAVTISIILTSLIVIDSKADNLKLRSLAGLWLLILTAFVLSKHPTRIHLRPILWCISLEVIIAFALRGQDWFIDILVCIIRKTGICRHYMHIGTGILFGYLATGTIETAQNETLFIKDNPYVFYDVPVILFFNVIFSMLKYLKISGWIFINIGWLFEISINTTAIESTFILFNYFWGFAKTVLFLQTHLGILTKSELHSILAASFASLGPDTQTLKTLNELKIDVNHFIFANFLTLPGTILFSKLFYPEVSITVSKYSDISLYSDTSLSNIIAMNLLTSAVKGAIYAVNFVCVFCGNILGFWAMLTVINDFIHWPFLLLDWNFLTLQWIVSLPFIPITYLAGTNFEESKTIALCASSGRLWGSDYALSCLSKIKKDLSTRAYIIAIYLCGSFTGVVMTGAYVGAIAYICPTKLPEIAQLLGHAICAGSFAVLSTAYIAGSIIV